MRGLRVCPVCPNCGSKKFKVINNEGKKVTVECKKCSKHLII